MQALASPVNDIIVSGKPDQSRFFMELIAPEGPMGFRLRFAGCSAEHRDMSGRGSSLDFPGICPLPAAQMLTLRLNTPPRKREATPDRPNLWYGHDPLKSRTCDVAILGGGPAGCATALALKRRGVPNVCLVESGDPSGMQVGETLPPDTRLILTNLAVWDDFTG